MTEKIEDNLNKNQESKFRNKAAKESDIKNEDDFNYSKNIDFNFSEFDPQKGNTSPRMLFKKRKNEDSVIIFKKIKGEDLFNSHSRTEVKVDASFEALLDFVREIYFSHDCSVTNESQNLNKESKNGFKFSSLDILLNPLRKPFTWETWSPYEIALFMSCICKFHTKFDLFVEVISTKTKEEIIDFYFAWKSSKYYKIWRNNLSKKQIHK